MLSSGWPMTVMRPRRWMSRPTEIMFVAIAQSTRSSILKYGVSRRRRASATLSVETRDVSSSTSENVLRSRKRPSASASPTRLRCPYSLIVFWTSSSKMRRAPPSSRRLLK